MPASNRPNSAFPTLHSERPVLPWAGDGYRNLRQHDVEALMSGSKERFIEILLAETSVEIDEIASVCEKLPQPYSPRFHYRMAVVIARLNVLLQNRYILAGAQAFEKFTALRKQVERLTATHWKIHDPSKIAHDKWTELRAWMRSIETIEEQLQQHRQCVCTDSSRTPGKLELESNRDALQYLIHKLPPKILTILDSMPAEAVTNGRLLPELADFATLQQLVYKAGEDLVSRFETLYDLVSRPGNLTEHPLMQAAEQTLAEIHALIELHGHHARTLQQAQIEFHSGNIDKTRHLLAPLKMVCFTDLQYEQLRKSVSRAVRLMNHLKTEKRADAVAHARTLLQRYPGIHLDSQIHREATQIIERGSWKRIVRYACAAILLLAGTIAISVHLKRKGDAPNTLRESDLTEPTAALILPPVEVSVSATTASSR